MKCAHQRVPVGRDSYKHIDCVRERPTGSQGKIIYACFTVTRVSYFKFAFIAFIKFSINPTPNSRKVNNSTAYGTMATLILFVT